MPTFPGPPAARGPGEEMATSFGMPICVEPHPSQFSSCPPVTTHVSPAAVMLGTPTLKVFRSSDAMSEPIVSLHQCKHVDRTTKRMQCTAALHLRAHKRGYLAVACDAGHQWVWCAHCCDCSLGTRGCIMPAHWMERDSYDTGKRNHMQRHFTGEGGLPSTGTGNEPTSKRLMEGRPLPKVKEVPGIKKMMFNSSLGAHQPMVTRGVPMGLHMSQVVAAAGSAAGSNLLGMPGLGVPGGMVPGASPLLQVAGVPLGGPNLNSSLYVTPKTTMLYMSPAASAAAQRNLWTDGSLALFSQGLQILQRCKHVDRKRNRMPCPCRLRTRNHKRGYLAIVCEAGHQWVWCSYCCDCARPQVGCSNPNHWMERDSFDTGRRNHMQRHLENYDANDDEDGQLMAMMAPRQVAMPKLVIQSATGSGPVVQNDGQTNAYGASARSSAATQPHSEQPHSEGDEEVPAGKEGGVYDEYEGEDQDSNGHCAGAEAEGEGSSSGKRMREQQHPLFNDELAELAATALMALAQNKRPK